MEGGLLAREPLTFKAGLILMRFLLSSFSLPVVTDVASLGKLHGMQSSPGWVRTSWLNWCCIPYSCRDAASADYTVMQRGTSARALRIKSVRHLGPGNVTWR